MAGVQIIVTTSGGPKIEGALLKRSGYQLRGAAVKASRAAGNAARPFIQAEAPVLTGATRKAVKVKVLRREVGVAVGPRIWYRHFVIGGTSRGVKPNPWVARGASRAANIARATFDAAMKVAVR